MTTVGGDMVEVVHFYGRNLYFETVERGVKEWKQDNIDFFDNSVELF